MAQEELSKSSEPQSIDLVSQALGPEVTGVIVPKVQNYSSSKILTDVLGPLNSFKFPALKESTVTGDTPVEIRDSSDRLLFHFKGVPTGQVLTIDNRIYPVYWAVLVDSLQRELLYVKPVFGSGLAPEANLSCKDGTAEQSLGKVYFPTPFSCYSNYKVTALNSIANPVDQDHTCLMEARGNSLNCCCFSPKAFIFSCPDPNSNSIGSGNGTLDAPGPPGSRVVGEMRRISNLTKNGKNRGSQVTFDPNLPILYKIWILYIAYRNCAF